MLPQKLFFRIGEVSGLVGVEPHVLRYWEREFRVIRPTKSAKGQRVYSRKDVENLLRVRDLLYRDGFTIAGAKKKLQRGDGTDNEGIAPEDRTRASGQLVRHHESTSGAGNVGLCSSLSGEGGGDTATSDQLRSKLLALRGEVELFLAELAASGQPHAETRR